MKEFQVNVKNNSLRNHVFCERICIAGTGCTTPDDVKQRGFELPKDFYLTKDEFFRCYRGLLAAMALRTANGSDEVELSVDGVKLDKSDVLAAVKEYREEKGWKEPKSARDYHSEMEKVMPQRRDLTTEAHVQAEEEKTQRMVAMATEVAVKSLESIIAKTVKAELEKSAAVKK